MVTDHEIKQQVREFYDQVGWQEISEGCYQNATYEDLRPVSRDYIHRCHLRVLRHLNPQGRLLLDAGSGPIQYPEYLEYSRSYKRRVCVDISIVALQEARKRLGDASTGGRGLFVVADIANLPFKPTAFDGIVSLHTIHHLPLEEHLQAYQELYRVLVPSCSAVVVNGWSHPPLSRLINGLADGIDWLRGRKRQKNRKHIPSSTSDQPQALTQPATDRRPAAATATRTFVRKHNAAWLEKEVGGLIPVKIYTWRSVNIRFLRTFIHERWAGRPLLRLLYWLEESFPHLLGKYGQYPLIVIRKGDSIPSQPSPKAHSPEGRTL